MSDKLISESQQHESPEIQTGKLLKASTGLFSGITILVLLCLLAWLLWIRQPESIPDAVNETTLGNVAAGKPILQPHPEVDIQAWRNSKAKRLESYGWLPGHVQIAHIPVERAMQIMAAHNTTNESPSISTRGSP